MVIYTIFSAICKINAITMFNKLYCYPYSTFILELMPIAWPFSENQCKGTMFSAITEKYHQEPFQS